MTVRMPAERSTRFWGKHYGQRQGDDQAYCKAQSFRPAVVSHKHHPLSALSRREWLTACLQQTPAGFPRHFLLYGRCRFKSMCFLLFRGFSALFRLFWLGKFPPSIQPAPHLFLLAAGTGQHRLFPAPCCTSPHPLQNRVPRVQVLLPLPGLLAKNDAGTKKARNSGLFSRFEGRKRPVTA